MSFVPPRAAAGFNGAIPLHLDGDPNGPLAGVSMWRGVKDLEHATLCRAFGLDQASFHFDVSSSMRGVGSLTSGAGGSGRGRREQDGLVFMGDRPVGKIRIARESQKFRDTDPLNGSDFYNLHRW